MYDTVMKVWHSSKVKSYGFARLASNIALLVFFLSYLHPLGLAILQLVLELVSLVILQLVLDFVSLAILQLVLEFQIWLHLHFVYAQLDISTLVP